MAQNISTPTAVPVHDNHQLWNLLLLSFLLLVCILFTQALQLLDHGHGATNKQKLDPTPTASIPLDI